jgi:catechol 2,3-dioxygenase-like lactoylglutathione lyase family enzyme
MKAADQFHVGIIVDDLDASIAQLSELFGYEWGMLVDVEQPVQLPAGDVTIPFRFRYSLQSPRLEVIQAQPGTLWTPAVGSGIHHVGYWSDDIGADSAALEAAGYPLEAAGGDGQGNRTWAYHHGASGPRIELITRALEPMMATLWSAP